MIDPITKETFWAVVEDCLSTFCFKGDSGRARREAGELRDFISNAPDGIPTEMTYHNEPFDVACDIADIELNIFEYAADYIHILERYGW